MKVKFLMAIAGGIDAYKGDVKNITNEKEAQRLIAAGICVALNETTTEKEVKKGKRTRINTR